MGRPHQGADRFGLRHGEIVHTAEAALEESLNADRAVPFHAGDHGLWRVLTGCHTWRQGGAGRSRFHQPVRHCRIAALLRQVVRWIPIHQHCATAEIRIGHGVMALPAGHLLGRRNQVDECRETGIEIAARKLIACRPGDVGVSLFLLVGHARDSPEVHMAVDQARNQIQVGAVEPLDGSRPARRSGACRAEDALDPPVMNRHSDAIDLSRTLGRDDRNVLNAQVLRNNSRGMHYRSNHHQADRAQSPDTGATCRSFSLQHQQSPAKRAVTGSSLELTYLVTGQGAADAHMRKFECPLFGKSTQRGWAAASGRLLTDWPLLPVLT